MRVIQSQAIRVLAVLSISVGATASAADFVNDFTAGGGISYTTELYASPPTSFKSNPAADPNEAGGIDFGFSGSASGEVSVKFHDDMGGCSNATAKTQTTTIQQNSTSPASIRGVGVVTNVSACKYILRTEWQITATPVDRKAGWRIFRFAWSNGWLTITIDGATVYSAPYSDRPDKCSMGDHWGPDGWVGRAVGSAYYDDLLIRIP